MNPIDAQRLDELRQELMQQAVVAKMRREIRHQADLLRDAVETAGLIDYYEDLELNESLIRLHDAVSDWRGRGGGKGQAQAK